MKKSAYLALAICCSLLFTALAGCIEGSYEKTETVLVKLDPQEQVQWIKTFPNDDYATAKSLAPLFYHFIQTSDKGFFLAGLYSNTTAGLNIRVLKTDEQGNLVWEQRLPASPPGPMGNRIFGLRQLNSSRYSVIGYDGSIGIFDTTGNVIGTANILDQVCRTNGTVCYHLTPFSLTPNPDGSLTWILTNGNFTTSRTSIITATVTPEGTLSQKESYPLENPDGVTRILRTNDGGFLLGKWFADSAPGGGKVILIEKTDSSSEITWDTPVKTCSNRSFCNNNLIAILDTDSGYDIIYESRGQRNASPADGTIHARLDRNGKLVQQERVPNLTGLPTSLFEEGGSTSEFSDLIPQEVLNATVPEKAGNSPTFGEISLLKTADGGYALVGTRYYYGFWG